jgi:hypothetical protein
MTGLGGPISIVARDLSPTAAAPPPTPVRREPDDALGLTGLAGSAPSGCRLGRNTRHRLAGPLRQAVFARLAGHEDANGADRPARDPATR